MPRGAGLLALVTCVLLNVRPGWFPGVLAALVPSAVVEDKIVGAVLGCLVADSLALGSNFEFDAAKIRAWYAREEDSRRTHSGFVRGMVYHAPGTLFAGQHNLYKGRRDGDQTDNGDGIIYLLEYFSKLGVKKTLPFNVEHYVTKYWVQMYKGHGKAYDPTACRACGARIDPAVKTFLENYEKGVAVADAGSESPGHVVRFVGALAVYHGDEDMLVEIATKTTRFTQRNADAVSAAEFWARMVHRVLDGMSPALAAQSAADAMANDAFVTAKVKEATDKVAEATDPDAPLSQEEFKDELAVTSMGRRWAPGTEPLKAGKSTAVAHAFPAALYFVLRYAASGYKDVVQANVLVGGDSSARAVPIGMIIGAYYGRAGIPLGWINGLTASGNVEKMLKPLMTGLAGTTVEIKDRHEEL